MPMTETVTILREAGWLVGKSVGDEVLVRCPSHEDRRPSASLNAEKGIWFCQVCRAGGTLAGLLSQVTGRPRSDFAAAARPTNFIPTDLIEACHATIWDEADLLAKLRARGVTDDMIRRARLGALDGRVTIPVFDDAGYCVNFRKYLPGGPVASKMLNAPGCGRLRLYQIADLHDAETAVVCGGEIKALVVGSLLREHGVAAVSATAGEGSWDPAWTPLFAGKHVHVMMDVDKAGRRAASRLAAIVRPVAASMRVLDVPIDVELCPKGDVNDWVGQVGATAEDILELMRVTPPWVPDPTGELATAKADAEHVAPEIELQELVRGVTVNKAVGVVAKAVAVDEASFAVPSTVRVDCTRDQPGCAVCPIAHIETDPATGFTEVQLDRGPRILDWLDAVSEQAKAQTAKRWLRLPKCKVVTITPTAWVDTYEVRLCAPIDMTADAESNPMVPAFVLGAVPRPDRAYRFDGVVYPHPRTSRATLLSTGLRPDERDIVRFVPHADDVRVLSRFAPRSWEPEAIDERLSAIVADLESNVTRIVGRRDMHVLIDLTFHSVLFFMLDGLRTNGWINMLLLGDTAQGKSETTGRLIEHYGVGSAVDCKNASIAGVLGGLEQIGGKWFVRWGALPQQDRRLVVLEEAKGLDALTFGRLTGARSTGVVDLVKIERRQAHARTRLIVVSNPRGNRSISSFDTPVQSVLDFAGQPEDVRRFDCAFIADEASSPRQRERAKVEHFVDSAVSRRLLSWGWTRAAEQVVIQDEPHLRRVADSMVAEFDEVIPLVDRGTMPAKLARLAAAAAVRTFSRSDDWGVIVRPGHVEVVAATLRRAYRAMRYDELSKRARRASTMEDPEGLMKALEATRHAGTLLAGLLGLDRITLEDIMDLCDMVRDEAKSLISVLVRSRAIIRAAGRNEYEKTPAFIGLLREAGRSGASKTTGA